MENLEKDCLIYYKGPRGRLRDYKDQLESMGFEHVRELELAVLGYDVAVYRYKGDDLPKGIEAAAALDERLFIEPSKDYLALPLQEDNKDHHKE